MSTIWFTSDLHFSHVNICKFAGRPWNDVEDMNRCLIDNWNAIVEDDDTVYVLGDVCMGKIAESLPLCGELKGHKKLLLGNHDRPFPANKKSDMWFETYSEYFEDIRLTNVIRIANQDVLLSHFPAIGDSHSEERFKPYRPEFDGWILHGHVHSKDFVDYENKQIHVGVDAVVAQYSPIHIDTIAEAIDGR